MRYRWAVLTLAAAWSLEGGCVEVSLDRAIAMAREYWVQRSHSPIIESEAALRLSRTAFLPAVESVVRFQKDVISPTPAPVDGSGTISVTQGLINMAASKNISARQSELASSACEVEATLLDITQNVASEYLDSLALLDEEALLKKRAERLNRVVTLMRETTRLKLSSQTDLLALETQATQNEILLLQVQADRIAAMNRLKARLGLPSQEDLRLVSRLGAEAGPDTSGWNTWADTAPSVLAFKGRAVAASKDIEAANSELIPTLSVSGTYGNPVVWREGSAQSLMVGAAISIPFYDQGSRSARKGRAARFREFYEMNLSARKLEVSNQISALIQRRQLSQAAFERAKVQRGLAERAFNGAWTLLSVGKGDYFTIQNADENLIEAERQWISIQRRLDQTNTSLRLIYESAQPRRSKANVGSLCQQVSRME